MRAYRGEGLNRISYMQSGRAGGKRARIVFDTRRPVTKCDLIKSCIGVYREVTMAVRTGSPRNTLAFMPTRELSLLIDPSCVPPLCDSVYSDLIRLVTDLRNLEAPVTVHLLLPTQSIDQISLTLAAKITPPLSLIKENTPPTFLLDIAIPSELREPLLSNTVESKRCLNLLAVGNAIQADGIVTNEQMLVNARYPLYQHHRLRIIPLKELGDTVEIFAHGHSIFWPSTSAERFLVFDLFYQWSHWKGRRFASWFNEVQAKIEKKELSESLRSALLNRYPFLLYSRDMVRFYELQMDFYHRRGLQRRFSMGVGFYVSTFYPFLWGMLDHLTIVAKYARDLKIDETQCGIQRKKFWKEFNTTDPRLSIFLNQRKISKWISVMADMRHAAAHRDLALPTSLLQDTEESRRSDAEILEIIKQERSYKYQSLLGPIMKSMEPMMIWLWRIGKMKVVAPNMVVIKNEQGTYLRDPVISIDHDLQYLTAIMDAFLVALFNNSRTGAW